ncbi:MAG: YdaS family helix-turn-helix protein [Steroidobacteraceae bacterium]
MGIHSACETAGGPTALARHLNVAPATVSQWCSGARPARPARCVVIERDFWVSRRLLRPAD